MSKVVKKIAPIIAVGAGIYFGMGGVGGISKAFGSVGKLIGSHKLATAGLAFQGYSAIQQRKYQKQSDSYNQKMVEADNESKRIQYKYRQTMAKKEKEKQLRYARINQGQMGGQLGILSPSGTSSYVGAVGSVGSSATANYGDIQLAADTSQNMTDLNITAAGYGTKANAAKSKAAGFSSMASLFSPSSLVATKSLFTG